MVRELTPEATAFTMADAGAVLGSALRFGIHPSLDGTRALTEALGRPQDSLAVIQVTGTNGKTSVARMTGALLAAHGWRTGVYTSPHMRSYAERVEVFGFATEETFAQAIGMASVTAREEGLTLTEFELLTGAALWLFARLGVEMAVLEVGMGGRWDATSVTDPAVAVVTGVGLDHADRLGETLGDVAFDKAHVIKPGSIAVLGPGVGFDTAPYFLARAEETGAHARAVVEAGQRSPAADDLTIDFEIRGRPTEPGGETCFDVLGIHERYLDLALRAPSFQAANATTAVAAAEAVTAGALDPRSVRRTFAQSSFPGRFETIDPGPPPVVVDGAHNPQAAAVLAGAIAEAWPDRAARPAVVLGMLEGKDARGVIAALAPVTDRFFVTSPRTPRALAAAELARQVAEETGADPVVVEDVAGAVAAAAEARPIGIVVTGSLYTVGEALDPSRSAR